MNTEYAEYLTIDHETRRTEVRELTETMAENLSEMATVMSLAVEFGCVNVCDEREWSTMRVEPGTLQELKRRAVWRDEHAGLLS